MKKHQRIYRIEVRKGTAPWRIHNPCMSEVDARVWIHGFNEVGKRIGVEARGLELSTPRLKRGGHVLLGRCRRRRKSA